MKYITLSLLALGVVFSTGCASNSPATNAAILQAAEVAVTAAASIGTSEAIASNPTWKPDFVLAGQVLTTVSTGTNTITTASVQAVLTQAGETNQVVETLITSGITAGESYLSSISSTNNATLLQFVGSLAAGINEGVGPATTASLKLKYNAK